MKRILTAFLALALALCSTGALAATHTDGATLAVRDNDFSVFVGWNNYPYRSDSVAPLVEMEVRSVLYGDLTRLVFTTVDEENQHSFAQGASILWQLDLADPAATPRAVAWIIGDAVGVEGDAVIYYVDQSNANALMGYLPYQGYVQQAVDFGAPIAAVAESADGVYAFLGGATYLYHPGTGIANEVPAAVAPPSANAVTAYAAFETILDGAGRLFVRLKGQNALVTVDQGVQAATAAAGMIYYLRGTSGGAMLMAYNYGEQDSRQLGAFNEPMYPQLVADGGSTVYALGMSREIYRYNALSGVLESFANVSSSVVLPTLCYSAPDLLVYDEGGPSGKAEFVSAIQAQAQTVSLPAQVVEGTPLIAATQAPAPAPAPTATPQVTRPDLCKGSRGDDVKALQQILDDHGYPAGKADGIFGANTVNAVKYLQCDLGVEQTGVVTYAQLVQLQMNLDKIPTFDPYVLVKSGDRNYRVAVMQSRLKALNWLGGKADGIYGKSTKAAVENFQRAAGLSADGIAGAHTLRALFSGDAPKYTPPAAPAQPSGNTGSREGTQDLPYDMDDSVLVEMVRWMNSNVDPANFGWDSFDLSRAVYVLQERLAQFGYMGGNQVTKSYDETTWLAVKHFQNDNDLLPHPSGEPDAKTLQALFPSTSARMAMF